MLISMDDQMLNHSIAYLLDAARYDQKQASNLAAVPLLTGDPRHMSLACFEKQDPAGENRLRPFLIMTHQYVAVYDIRPA